MTWILYNMLSSLSTAVLNAVINCHTYLDWWHSTKSLQTIQKEWDLIPQAMIRGS